MPTTKATIYAKLAVRTLLDIYVDFYLYGLVTSEFYYGKRSATGKV